MGEAQGSLESTGFPNVQIVCAKRQANCTCIQAAAAKVELKPVAAVAQRVETPIVQQDVPAAADPAPAALSKNDLDEIARLARAKKKKQRDLCGDMLVIGAWRIAEALLDENTAVWKEVLNLLDYRFKNDEFADLSLTDIRFEIGKKLMERKFAPDSVPAPDLEFARRSYNGLLRSVGLAEIEEMDHE
jgi:hypothetical protein